MDALEQFYPLPVPIVPTARYDVLDQNGDILLSTDSWWVAAAHLREWQSAGYYGTTDSGSIRDNEEDSEA